MEIEVNEEAGAALGGIRSFQISFGPEVQSLAGNIEKALRAIFAKEGSVLSISRAKH